MSKKNGMSDEELKLAQGAIKKLLSSKGKSKYFVIFLLVAVFCAVVMMKAGVIPDVIDTDETNYSGTASEYTDTLEVHYIDVGQGDCTLIKCGGETMLIDAGENGHEDEVFSYLREENIGKLDYVVCTHQHSDHMGGLPETIDEFGMKTIIMPRLTEKQTPTNKTYKAFITSVKNSGATVKAAVPGDIYTLGGAEFEILGPITDDAESLNNMSAVIMLKFGEKKFLFMGDAEKEEELEILEAGKDLDCDVLKVAHHCSKTSSCDDFLAAATPEICVIHCGEDNDYGHPHKQPLERLKKYTSEIYRTDICGNILITCNGTELSVSYERQ